ncbi:hypothetical protein BXT86_00165 [candidate division WOR-3 bacterium 4484_100]|uniref:Uncharacterized protein n=1 Tax=candidate division WOR-3 bacterium 4484_100 TaxID=1936077 RepID=A0A1V4QH16_UNCW3|nr:MAG: hypothetical protein BXT86_00165 [candidate division WOR-3 bacterium 4484_100]
MISDSAPFLFRYLIRRLEHLIFPWENYFLNLIRLAILFTDFTAIYRINSLDGDWDGFAFRGLR